MRLVALALLLVGAPLAASVYGGGDAPEAAQAHPAREAAQAPEPEVAVPPSYSPFVLDLQVSEAAQVPFHLISFKDVGMSLPDDAARQMAYESLAEALSLELGHLSMETPSGVASGLVSSVRHDLQITDPDMHLACEGGHLYVDVWQSSDEGPYGYSLWSGCGEDDRFAYNDRVAAVEQAPDSMDPLAHEIAQSLEQALRSRCFQRSC